MYYCYIRKSTDTQSYARQYLILKEKGYINGVNCIYKEETYTGKSLKRPVLDELLANIKENDTIVVEALSRFSRGGLYQTVELLKNLVEKRRINVIILKENFNLRAGANMDASTKLLLGIFSILSEFERDLLSERTKEGMKATKKQVGRPTTNNITLDNFVKTLELQVNNKESVRVSCKHTKYPVSTFILRQKEYKEKYNISDKERLLSQLKREVLE